MKLTEKIKNLKHRIVVRVLAVLTGTLLLAATLSGCGADDSDCQGDRGKVSAKEIDTNGKQADDYELTIRRTVDAGQDRPVGSTYEREVTQTAYDDWYRVGSNYPSTKHCTTDGKVK
jgi:hypothetical protein